MNGENLKLQCGECSHVWIAAPLPIEVNELVRITRHSCCPACGDKDPFIYFGGKKDG